MDMKTSSKRLSAIISMMLALIMVLALGSAAFAENVGQLAQATTLDQVKSHWCITEESTDAKIYYDDTSGIDGATDTLDARGKQDNNVTDYSFEIKDADRKPVELTGVVFVAFPLPATYFADDTYNVYVLKEDGTTKPVETCFIEDGYVYIKTDSAGSFRLVNNDYQRPFRCDLCTQYEQVTSNPDVNVIYKYLITFVHFIIHNVTALVRGIR